jgi:hypothetical protein
LKFLALPGNHCNPVTGRFGYFKPNDPARTIFKNASKYIARITADDAKKESEDEEESKPMRDALIVLTKYESECNRMCIKLLENNAGMFQGTSVHQQFKRFLGMLHADGRLIQTGDPEMSLPSSSVIF